MSVCKIATSPAFSTAFVGLFGCFARACDRLQSVNVLKRTKQCEQYGLNAQVGCVVLEKGLLPGASGSDARP